MDTYNHLIGGQETPSSSGKTFVSVNPANGKHLANVAFGEPVDVERAVFSAQDAFTSGVWSGIAPDKRAAMMRRVADQILENRDEIASVESQDTGKPLAQARSEVTEAAGFFTTFAGLAELPNGRVHPTESGYFAYSQRTPYGVVGAIAPWNFPFLLAAWKTAPAMAVGNCVVLKMAEQTPLSTSLLGRMITQAGVPAGVFNVLHGDGTTGKTLVNHPRVPKITFTGSTAVGQEILRDAADNVKSVHLELGGKTPNIIFDDADLEQALAGSVFTAFYNQGQICTSGSRLLVQSSIAQVVTDQLVERARNLRVGDPMDDGVQLGPVVSEDQLERVMGYVEAGVQAGATLASGGSRVEVPDSPGGFFIEPTIFTDVDSRMRIAQEEIFGPVLSVMTFEDEDQAIELANDVMYGLAATVWTNDLRRAYRVAENIDAGLIWTNCPHFLPLNVPYEGHKMSGLGEDLGVEAAGEFTHLKTHIIAHGGAVNDWI